MPCGHKYKCRIIPFILYCISPLEYPPIESILKSKVGTENIAIIGSIGELEVPLTRIAIFISASFAT